MPKTFQVSNEFDSLSFLGQQLLVGGGLFAAVALTLRDRDSVVMIGVGVGCLLVIIGLLRRRDRATQQLAASKGPLEKPKPALINETFVKMLRKTVEDIDLRRRLQQNWDDGETVFDRLEEDFGDRTISVGKSDLREPEWRTSDRLLAQLPPDTFASAVYGGLAPLPEEVCPWNPEETDSEKIKEAMIAVLLEAPKDISVFKIKRPRNKDDSLFVPLKDKQGVAEPLKSPPKKAAEGRMGQLIAKESPKSESNSDPKRSLRKQDMFSPKTAAPPLASNQKEWESPRALSISNRMGTIWETEEASSIPNTPPRPHPTVHS
jgi:hypothetical protein